MEGDPAAELDAHGADFFSAGADAAEGRLGGRRGGILWDWGFDPDAGGAGGAGAGDAEGSEGVDDDVFEEAHVVVEVEVVSVERNDGVGDELAGAVEGDVAAAIGFGEFDAAELQEGGGGEEVFTGAGVAANGYDGRVFDEDECAGGVGASVADGDLGVDIELFIPGRLVGEGGKVDNL